MPASRRVVGTALAAVIGGCLALAAQAPQPTPTFRSDINYVRVDLYPTVDGQHVSDLRADDVEVREDGVLQKIEAFEHVAVGRRGLADQARSEPQTVAQSRELLEQGRSRVFVIFLDVNYVEMDGSRAIRQPLINALQQLIGEDDLVGVMTPEMAASDVTFARRTGSIESMLSRLWGNRGRAAVDERERMWQQCYPGSFPTATKPDDRGVADEMIERRRQSMTLDALSELVDYLRFVREERKALLVVSSGWRLVRADQTLKRRLYDQPPAGANVGVDPRTGRLGLTSSADAGGSVAQCESDRLRLADLDTRSQFDAMLNRANRSNVTFYPIDPRGLAVFDTPIDVQRTGAPPAGTASLPSPAADNAWLRERQDNLRNLAASTDGIAILNTNQLDRGLRRVFDDLSSYYLLGYYSTGKADGKFHKLQVTVRRPRVDVRARAGFEAPTAEALSRSVAPPPAPPSASANALTAALGALAAAGRPSAWRFAVASAAADGGRAVAWLTGELNSGDEWRDGAEVQAMFTLSDGATTSARTQVAAGARAFRVEVSSAGTPADIQVRVAPRAGGQALFESIKPSTVGSLIVSRRSPAAANRDVPAADMRFRRNEQVVVERLILSDASATAQLLDRAGATIPIPIDVTIRQDPDGRRWAVARLPLAPLAPGDYAIAVTVSHPAGETSLLGIRVAP